MIHVEGRGLEELRRVGQLMSGEADRRRLQGDLLKGLFRAAEPEIGVLRHAIASMPTSGKQHSGPGLRRTVSRSIRLTYRLRGRDAAVRITAGGKMPRNFRSAPRALQGDWRHPVFGAARWVRQRGLVQWFDSKFDRRAQRRYRGIVMDVLDDYAKALARRLK